MLTFCVQVIDVLLNKKADQKGRPFIQFSICHVHHHARQKLISLNILKIKFLLNENYDKPFQSSDQHQVLHCLEIRLCLYVMRSPLGIGLGCRGELLHELMMSEDQKPNCHHFHITKDLS